MSANDVHCKNCNAPPPTLPPIFAKKLLHFHAFKKITVAHPASDWGNRCGHQPFFLRLPPMKKDGTQLKQTHFLRYSEEQTHAFFRQHYQAIFHQCPSLKAAHATKTGVMRSEARENLSIVCCVLLRNIDLTTFAILETRTLTEIYRFIAHALAAEGKGRRFSENRFFRTLKQLRDAGLIECSLPKAKQQANGQWRAAAAKLHFTDRFWVLIGIGASRRRKVQNEAKRHRQMNPSRQEKANEEVFNRQLRQQMAAGKRRLIADNAKYEAELKAAASAKKEALYQAALQQPQPFKPAPLKPLQTFHQPPVDDIFHELRLKIRERVHLEAIKDEHPEPNTVANAALQQLTMQGNEAIYQLGKKLGLL